MKLNLIIAATAIATAVALYSNSQVEAVPAPVREAFTQWAQKYGKSYGSPNEYNHRLNVFYQNVQEVEELRTRVTYEVEVGKFADLTKDEFITKYTGLNFIRGERQVSDAPVTKGNPSSVDWRTSNIVNGIKDQGACGSCWAFSAIQTIESAWAQAGNTLTEFAEQQLVDCSGAQGNMGCSGGWMDWAFKYFQTAGTMTETDYPYKAVDQQCQADQSKYQVKVTQIHDVTANDGQALEDAVAGQVISIAVDANAFFSYSSGVLAWDGCGTGLNHGVGIIGYDTDSASGKDYWIVRNSWGTSWAGLGGYVWIEKDVTRSGAGACGCRMKASYASVAAF
jgi:C1A family cysteine protease